MIRLLAAGIDSLYWSARAESKQTGALMRARSYAETYGAEAMPWACVEGFTLSVLPYGRPGYPVALDCAEFRVYVTESRARPTAYVQLRSSFLQEVGAEAAYRESVRVVSAILDVSVTSTHPSRVDLFVDVAGWTLVADDRRSVVSHARLRAFSRTGSDELETLQVGKSPLMVRLYRKDIEVVLKGGHAPMFWNGWEGPVTRVEAQISGRRLGEFHFSDCGEVFAATGDIWRYATTNFLELREPGSGAREAWELRPEWRLVQETGMREFPASGLVPFKVVEGRRDKIVSGLLGYVASYASFDGIESPREALEQLLREFPGLVTPKRGRTFESEVRQRRARLPRAVRRLRDGLLPAGKDEDDRRSHLKNSITTDEVGGHA